MGELRICAVSGSRADYGLLYWVLKDLQRHPRVELQLAVTGMHLSPEFGNTIQLIREDGFHPAVCIETVLDSDRPSAIAKSIGLGVIGFADAFVGLDPHVVLVLGDRYEIFAAVQAAYIQGRTVAHIAGGDVTEGAVDESLRHSISKMAQIHFVTNADSARRVRQMGEDPSSIHEVGSPGLDYIKRTQPFTRSELEEKLGHKFGRQNLLVTFHPATLSVDTDDQCRELLAALEAWAVPDVRLIFTMPNSDAGGRTIAQLIREFVRHHPNASVFSSLGHLTYLSLLREVDVMIGNSSSGIYEMPSFRKPTVNIGDRQKGRIMADSVINCLPQASDIVAAIKRALKLDCTAVVNPYGDGESSGRIIKILTALPASREPRRKRFCDL